MITFEQFMSATENIPINQVDKIEGREYDYLCIAYLYYVRELENLRSQILSFPPEQDKNKLAVGNMCSDIHKLYARMQNLSKKIDGTLSKIELTTLFTGNNYLSEMENSVNRIRLETINVGKLSKQSAKVLPLKKFEDVLLDCVSLHTTITKIIEVIQTAKPCAESITSDKAELAPVMNQILQLFKAVPERFVFNPKTLKEYEKKTAALVVQLAYTQDTISAGHGYKVSDVTSTKYINPIEKVGRSIFQQTRSLFHTYLNLYQGYDTLIIAEKHADAKIVMQFMTCIGVCAMYACLLQHAVLILLKSYLTAQHAIHICKN